MKAPKLKQIVIDGGLLVDGFLTTDRTLVIKGKAAAKATVTVFDNGVKIGKAKADKKGKWSFDTGALPDGPHSFSAKAKVKKDKSKLSKEVSGTVDATAPDKPGIDLSPGSDTGRSSADDVTADDTPTLTGTAEAGSQVTIRDGGTVLGTAVANGSGQWSFTTATLASGVHSFTATATDAAGNTSAASSALAVTVKPFIDLASITPTQGFVIQGDAAYDHAGYSVASAGDVNGDGIDDLIVGAPSGGDGGTSAGEAYVVFGSGSGFGTAVGGRQVIDLTNLSAADGFIIQGDSAGDGAGWSVASAGDVNGDGFDDLVVGAQGGDDGDLFAGEAYVVFGSASAFGTAVGGRQVIDLTSLSASEGFVIQGDAAYDYAGWSVASAGDVNGDGFDDLIVGSHGGDDGGDGGGAAGEAYVVFGSGAGFGTAVGGRQVIDLTSIAPTQGFIIQGDAAYDRAGWSVASAGDVNGDGFDDLIVGANGGDDGGNYAGEAYVVFGSGSGFGAAVGGRQVIDLASITPTQGFIIQGDATLDQAGWSVASAGDVNGDGFDDLIVGAPFGDDGGSYAGEAYVVFGSGSGFGTAVGGRQVIDLTTLSAAEGFIIQGDEAGDQAGISIGSVGDVNGDSFDDLVVGAPFGDDGGSYAGEAYVVFGSGSGFGTAVGGRQVIDLTLLSAGQGFIIQGDAPGDKAGFSVSSAGDVNGDGFDDLIVGARDGDDDGADAGEAYVILGGAFGRGDAPVTTTGSGAAEMLIGGLGDDTLTGGGGADVVRGGAGDDMITVGDLTFREVDGGSGTDTLRIDATGLSLDLTNRQIAANIEGIERIDLSDGGNTLVLDQLTVFNETPASGSGLHILTVDGDPGATVQFVDVQWTGAGTVVEGVATYNRYVLDTAELRIEQGITVSFPSVFDLTTLARSQGFIIQGDAAYDEAGRSVASAGDVNGDGFDDLIVGAPFGGDGGTLAGEAYVVFGSGSGFGAAVGGRQVIDLTSLSAANGFIIQGDETGDEAGRSVATAGDVNGDGFDDVIVGAQGGDDGGSDAGEAYVVFGSASGFGTAVGGRQVIDLTSLSAGQGFIIRADAAYDRGGFSVSSAGDVNGDGFDDLIVGAPSGDDGGDAAGEAYVVFGSGSGFGAAVGGRQVIDLASITPTQGFIIQGDAAGDIAGWSVASAGDVNGDGLDDVIVGAPLGDDGGSDAGEAYVVFGSGSGFGTAAGGRQVIDLTTVSAAEGFIIQGDLGGDEAGFKVSAAGDVNGDGFDDLIVGAPLGDGGGSHAGETYVVFGKASGFGSVDGTGRSVIDLSNVASSFTAAIGFVIRGDAAFDRAGYSVASAGDVNGDGFDDLIVGAYRGDDGGDAAGEAYVVFGSGSGFGTVDGTGRSVIDLTTLGAAQGFIVQGDATYDGAGISVSSAGDVNGDGFDDLIVGAPNGGDDAGSDAGEAYVLLGGAFGRGDAPVTTTGSGDAEMLIGGLGDDTLTGGGGADVLRGGAGDDVLGVSSTGFADVDGGTGTDTLRLDGSGLSIDLATALPAEITSIERIDLTGTGNNTLTVDRLAVLDLSEERSGGKAILTVTGDAGDVVNVTDAGWLHQGSVVDGGLSFERYTSGNAELRIEYGVTANFARVIDLTTITSTQGFIIQGDEGGDRAAYSVGSAGDVNGDGFDDLIVGAYRGDDGGSNAGEAYVVFGSGSGFGTTVSGRQVIDLTTLSAADGFIIQGDEPGDQAGFGVNSAGDVNGDGFDDLIIGARYGDDGGGAAGEAYVVFGSGSGFGTAVGGRQVIDLTSLSVGEGFIIQGDEVGDRAGWSVAAAGDVDGDGFDDLIVGARYGDDGGGAAGEAYVVFGSGSGFGTAVGGRQVIDLTSLSAGEGFIIQGDLGADYAGHSVAAAGDVNGDGFDDLIVGAQRGDDGGADAGEAYVVFGSGSGFGTAVGGRQVIDLASITPTQGFIIRGDAADDRAGHSVAAAGDINGDGFDDLLVGAPLGDDGGGDAGEAYVVFGSGSGFGTAVGGRQVIDLTTLSAGEGFVIQGTSTGDNAGTSVASAGDVNGDGFDDLIVGAVNADDGGVDAGGAHVVFGSGSGFGTAVGGRQVIDLATLSASDGFIIQGDAAGDQAGRSVASAGDVNGDGFDDLIVGAPLGDGGGGGSGDAYVILGGAFGLGATPVTTSGSGAAEMLIGGTGDDVLSGGGGIDVLRSGAGNDTLSVGDLTFGKVDGGSGTDTLAFAGNAETIDLTTIADTRIEGIEALDVRGTGSDTIVLGALDILHLSDTPHAGFTGADSHQRLVVYGDAGDTLDLRDFDPPGPAAAYQWSLAASDKNLDGTAGGGFDFYNLVRNSSVVASVAVDADMTIL